MKSIKDPAEIRRIEGYKRPEEIQHIENYTWSYPEGPEEDETREPQPDEPEEYWKLAKCWDCKFYNKKIYACLFHDAYVPENDSCSHFEIIKERGGEIKKLKEFQQIIDTIHGLENDYNEIKEEIKSFEEQIEEKYRKIKLFEYELYKIKKIV
uniref:Uncharacterized protein n=1 Tax=viral metagenome TaxID=1070528 RepID=A0A6M3LST5_9ZZZZ